MADLADRFELKLSLAQQMSGEDPKSVTADAFFGPYQEQEFQKSIMSEGSKFMAAWPPKAKACNIGAKVDSDTGVAEFLVSTTPPTDVTALKAALVEDFKRKFGATPPERLAQRKAKGEVKPGVKSSHPAIITISAE